MCKWCRKGDLVVKRASLSSQVPFQAHWAAVPALLCLSSLCSGKGVSLFRFCFSPKGCFILLLNKTKDTILSFI